MQVPPGFEPDAAGGAPPGFEPDTGAGPRPFTARKHQFTEPGESPENPIDEQHPDLDWWTRTKAQNWSANPEVAARFLESQGFDAIPKDGGEIAVRSKKGGKWHKLESSEAEFSDITDVGSDIVSGVAQTAAAVPAGLAAAAATLPAGPWVSIPAGLAAGSAAAGAVGAGVEGLKQATAPMMGLDPSLGEAGSAIGREAVLGAASVPIGAGIGKGLQLAGKYAGKASKAIGLDLPTLANRLRGPLRVENAEAAHAKSSGELSGTMKAKRGALRDTRWVKNLREGSAQQLKEAEESRYGIEELARMEQLQERVTGAGVRAAEQQIAPEELALEGLKAGEKRSSLDILAKDIEQAPIKSAARTAAEEASITEGRAVGDIAEEQLDVQAKGAVERRDLGNLQAAKAQRAREIYEEAQQAEPDFERFMKESRKVTATQSQTSTTTQGAGKPPVSWNPKELDQALSFRADFLRAHPILLQAWKHAYGDQFVREISEEMAEEMVKVPSKTITASLAMRTREKIDRGILEHEGPEALREVHKKWWEAMSAILQNHPELNKGMSEQEKRVFESIIRGTATQEDLKQASKTTYKMVDKWVSQGRVTVPEELALKRMESQAASTGAKATLEETGEALAEKQATRAARTDRLETEAIARLEREPLEESWKRAKFAKGEKELELGPTGKTGSILEGAESAHRAQRTKTAAEKSEPLLLDALRRVDKLKGAKKKADILYERFRGPGSRVEETTAAHAAKLEENAATREILRKERPMASTIDIRRSLPPLFGVLSDPALKAGNRLADFVGRKMQETANAKITKNLAGILKIAKDKGPKPALTMLNILMRNDPELRKLLGG